MDEARDSKGRFKKGSTPNPGGMTKGTKQRATLIKEAFYKAFENVGGEKELTKWIMSSPKNKQAFFQMLLSILPKELKGEGFQNITNIMWGDVANRNSSNTLQSDRTTKETA